MKPTTVNANIDDVFGTLVTVDHRDMDMRLADSDERGVFRDNAEWNHKAIVCDGGRVILDIHEWEGDDTDYEEETDLYGAVYYTVFALSDVEGRPTFVEYDGGVYQYCKDTDLSDFLDFALPQVMEASAWSRGAVA